MVAGLEEELAERPVKVLASGRLGDRMGPTARQEHMRSKRQFIVAGIVVVCLGTAALAFFAFFGKAPSNSFDLPAESEVARMSAELMPLEMVGPAVPEFIIPSKYVADILRAFRPAAEYDYGAAWDDEMLGKVTIVTTEGKTMVLSFPFSGHYPLCYSVNGRRYIRHGNYKPISRLDGIYCPECTVLQAVLRDISLEQSGNPRQSLPSLFDMLAISRGDKPPRDDQ